jgi:hypothetical protein
MKELKIALYYIGFVPTALAITLCAVAFPFIKIAKLLGHKYWQW